MNPQDVVSFDGARYVSVEALRRAANDPRILAQAACMLKVGADKGHSVGTVIGIMLASYATSAAGVIPCMPLTQAEVDSITQQLDEKLSPSAFPGLPRPPRGGGGE